MVRLGENPSGFFIVNQRQQIFEDFPLRKSEVMPYGRCWRSIFIPLFCQGTFQSVGQRDHFS